MAGAEDRVGVERRGHTRRHFFAGIAAGGLAQGLVAPALAQGPKPCAPLPPGVRTSDIAASPDGRTVWTTDAAARTITAHHRPGLTRGKSIDVGGAPIGIAISPDGKQALVTTAFYDHPGLAAVDLGSGKVSRMNVGAEPYAVAYTPSGRSAYVSGGGRDGTLTPMDPVSGRVERPIALGPHPRGLAIHPKGKRALVAVNGGAEVVVIDVEHGQVARRIATPAFPYLVAVSPDGTRAFVTHNGFGAHQVTPINAVKWRARTPVNVGLDPAGLAFDASGTRVLVADSGAGTVSLLDARTGRLRSRLKPNGAPRAIATSPGRAYVADGHTGAVSAARLPGVRLKKPHSKKRHSKKRNSRERQ